MSEGVPGDADARFRQKFRVVLGEDIVTYAGLRFDDAVLTEQVVRGASVSLIHPVRRFDAEAYRYLQIRADLDAVLREARDLRGSPAEWSGGGHHGEGSDGALQESGEAAEGCLS